MSSRRIQDIFAKAERARAGRKPTPEEIAAAGILPTYAWKPCERAEDHQWRAVPFSEAGHHRCTVRTCRVLGHYNRQGQLEATPCLKCGGPSCVGGGFCPACGGVFPRTT